MSWPGHPHIIMRTYHFALIQQIHNNIIEAVSIGALGEGRVGFPILLSKQITDGKDEKLKCL